MDDSFLFGRWAATPPPGEEVVVSGISGRFPDSNNVQHFQENLFNKRDLISDDDRRWKLDHPEIPHRNGKIYNIDKLDAGYFGLHYRQANIMDPMTMKFMEVAIESIVDAGVNPSELQDSKTAVYVGACFAEVENDILASITNPQSFGVTGYYRSLIAHRVSYFLKLKGPSCIADTACSSSLNALELAFKMIRAGKCDQAIIGGVNLILHPGFTRQFFRLGLLCTDGACKVFDESADGYVRSETIACIFLQKAKNARRIYSQVVYTRINCDGFKPDGITFPSSQIQQELMTEIFEHSDVDVNQLSFLEAHGTGTKVGDLQEVEAIDLAIGKKRTEPLLVGSVKCSVGHTEPASGLCSLAKVLIAMETGYIPPNIHLKKIKKGMLGFEEGRMIPVTKITKLDRDDALIGINNFGFGGNNAHILLRRFNKLKKNKGVPEDDIPRLVCVSGRTEEAVASLLQDINTRPLDSEHVGLLHQVFKRDVTGHLYRGFTVVTKNGSVKTEFKISVERKPLYIFLGKFENSYKNLVKDLAGFSCFQTTVTRINNLLEKKMFDTTLKTQTQSYPDGFCSFVAHIAIIDILKLLEIEPSAVYSDSLGKLANAYYDGSISLKGAVKMFSDKFGYDPQVDLNCYHTITINYLKNQLKNSLVLNLSDEILNADNNLHFNGDSPFKFLKLLGRLYEEGYNPQIHKLYPPVEFPVSRATPMISPQIQWDYRKTWYTFKFGELINENNLQMEYMISTNLSEELQYLSGHIIDGRNLFPATAYLYLVWQTFIQKYKLLSDMEEGTVVIENCKFIRSLTLRKAGVTKLLVTIQEGSGSFEVVADDSVLVTGKIFATQDVSQFSTELPILEMNDNRSEILDHDEIYRELYLRGYNYKGLFKRMAKCNVDATAGLVKWENNWVTFLDNLLQLKVLQTDTRLLYVPVGIRKLVINSTQHKIFIEKQRDSMCPVYNYKECNIIKSGKVEIQGLQAAPVSKKRQLTSPVLEKYVFVSNNLETDLEQSMRIMTQIILEDSLENNFKAVEIIDDFTSQKSDYLLPLVSKALDDLPLIASNLTISSKTPVETIPSITVEDFALSSSSNLLLIVGSKILQRPSLLNQTLNALSPNGFVISREELDFIPQEDNSIEILLKHVTSSEKCFLFRKVREVKNSKFLEISSESFDWLPQLQKFVKQEADVLIYSHNTEPEGILGLVNCLRRKAEERRIRCFFMMDEAPEFDSQNKFYASQFKKQLPINIFKNGEWGTYRHLLLEDVKDVESEHIFLNNSTRGGLSSLRWVQGPINSKSKVDDKSTIIFPYYCGVNFKDIMLATGRVNVSTITTDRLVQECPLGFEFAGRDINGRRVMGMTDNMATASILVHDTDFIWEVPANWSLEDASTVVVVYCSVLFALLKAITIKPGMSILIHSATGGVGLAALNVCFYHGLIVYVTVGTQEKKDYLKKVFPQIPDSHVGNSRDTTFEEMIKVETKGRGVDIVLNSLSEKKLKASIRCMAEGGHFLEIGKYDLLNDSSIETLFLKRNISYHGVMLDRVMDGPIKYLKDWVVEKLYEGMRLGYVKPLPRTVFQMDETVEAYKYMTTGKHMGKIVIKLHEDVKSFESVKGRLFKAYPRFTCNPEKCSIIVGGLGGFGLELADWLYLRGGKKLILVSRTGIQSGYQKQRISNWIKAGVEVQISTKDITTLQGCLDLINEGKELGPVDAIFNLAVVLKDALFKDQTVETFETSFAPKAQATINLDKITRENCLNLRHFVVFSSVSCGRGNTGQTNYGMANSIMERICEKRKLDGLPGLAIQWGAIGDVGLVAKMQKENKELVIGGTLQQKISSCLEVLDIFLNQDHPIVSSMVVAEKIDRNLAAGSPVDTVALILGIKNVKSVSPHTTFAELGMDSMMGVEVNQTLERDFGIYIPAKEMRTLTLAKLVELDVERQKYEESSKKSEKHVKELLTFMPRESNSSTLIVELSDQATNSKKGTSVFVFPGLEGVFHILEPLTKNLTERVFGIEYNNRNSEGSIQEIAKNLFSLIEETVSKEKTFCIVGYSFGVAVATEVVVLLEAKGYIGNFVAIEGSPAYLTTAAKTHCPTEDDKDIQDFLTIRILSFLLPANYLTHLKEKIETCETMEERFELAMSLVPPEVSEEKPSKKAIVGLYRRFKAVLNYKFDNEKIKSPVHLYKAKFPMLSEFAEDYQFSELCQQPVQLTELNGDHATILNENRLVDDINKLLEMHEL